MIDFKHYAKSATRTESVIQSIAMSPKRLEAALNLAVFVSDVLDMVKKEIFYGKKMSDESVATSTLMIEDCLADLLEDNGDAEPTVYDERITRTLHGAIGKFTEAGEVITAVDNVLFGKVAELDVVNIAEELGDDAWYSAIICDALDIDMEDALRKNINKLKARYPDKFTAEAALTRNLDFERSILEAK